MTWHLTSISWCPHIREKNEYFLSAWVGEFSILFFWNDDVLVLVCRQEHTFVMKMLWEYVTIFFLPCQMQESVFSVCLLWQSGELSENTKYDLPKVMTLRNVSSERLPAGSRNSSSPLLNSPYQSLVSAGSLQVSHYQLQPSAFSLLSRILAFKFAFCLPFFSWSKRSHWFSAVQPFPATRNDLFQTPSLPGLKLKANFSSQSSKLLYFL